MINRMPVRRRVILSRMASGGSAVLCTFLGGLGGNAALATPSRASSRRPAPLVILDPGHGGHDPGATGVTGTLEKDITLASALRLKACLEAGGHYRVELTRTMDRYVGREDRVDIARELGASLFLSMHADRLSDPSVRGASVYTLAKQASDRETEALADRENGFAAGEDSPAGHVPEILASLAARANRIASSRIAHQLASDMGRDLPVLPQPERHANFTVLHSAGIPSVLIEMGFLSNPADETSLNDPGHRELIARSVTRAVDAWFASVRDIGQG
jgi:N-acetylmuramoyl-L-alanine amidase